MNRLITFAVAAALAAAWLPAQNAPSPESLIRGYEEDLGTAMIHRDVTALAHLVGEDWTIQSESGVTGTREGFLSDIQSGKLEVKSFRLHDVHIRVFGDVAMVQGFDDEESAYDGKTSNGTYNWLDVWVRRDGRWVSVATQLTRVSAAK
jgi:ketosteroid isomerase-like protein